MNAIKHRWSIVAAKIILEAGAVALSFYLAFFLRFDLAFSAASRTSFVRLVPLLIATRIVTGFAVTRYRLRWRSTSLYDFWLMALGVGLGSFVFWSLVHLPHFGPVPRGVVLFEGFITLNLLMGLRMGARVAWNHSLFRSRDRIGPARRVLILGAGTAGERIAREIRQENNANLIPVGFVDDDPAKHHRTIQGISVLGSTAAITELVERYRVDQILIAIPSLRPSDLNKVVRACSGARADLTLLPSLPQILSRQYAMQSVRKVSVEDLLDRSPVRLDMESIAQYTSGKRVLVTGAGGSIGSELCRQIVGFKPSDLMLLDFSENSLYWIETELFKERGFPVKCVIADVRDRHRLDEVFRGFLPEVVFHAAAHKHVPLMEDNPQEAVKNNVFGTLNLAELAVEYGVGSFVMISTDKAVNPTSVMGATKRIAENVVQSLAQRIADAKHGDTVVPLCGFCSVSPSRAATRFTSVRFGNVLGSSGSVIPTMQRQIEKGGPVTVTHEEMVRFFMTIPEAVQLVLQAAGLSKGGQIFVLDMGSPVKIMDLAWNLVRLSGFVPNKDVQIEVTGIRPGEKLYEEVLTAEEGTDVTGHEKIYAAKYSPVDHEALWNGLNRLERAVLVGDPVALKARIAELVPSYTPNYTRDVIRADRAKETAAASTGIETDITQSVQPAEKTSAGLAGVSGLDVDLAQQKA